MAVLNFPRPADPIAETRHRLEVANPSWGDRRTLTCACCGQRYRQREWTCCAPPGGMTTGHWFAQWHHDCPTANAAHGPGRRRCPRHCRCPRSEPQNNLPFDTSEPVAQVIDRARHPSPERTSPLSMEEEKGNG